MLTTQTLRDKALSSPNFDLPISDGQMIVLNIKMKEALQAYPWYAQRKLKLEVLNYIFSDREVPIVSTKFMMMGEAQAVLDAATFQEPEFLHIVKEALRDYFDH